MSQQTRIKTGPLLTVAIVVTVVFGGRYAYQHGYLGPSSAGSAAVPEVAAMPEVTPEAPQLVAAVPLLPLPSRLPAAVPGAHGIRLENLLLVQEAKLPASSKPFLRFETLTLAPFDTRLIDVALLDAAERAWLDAYHQRVLREIGPKLDGATRRWLEQACAPLSNGS